MKVVKIFDTVSRKNVLLKPYVYLKPSLVTAGKSFFILLLPQLLMLVITKSYSAVFNCLATVLAALASDAIYNLIKKQLKFSWLSTLVQGLLIGLLVPASYNPVALFFITFVTIFLAKYAFGGFASSWANTTAVTVAVVYMLNMSAFPGFQLTREALSGRNAALSLILDGTVPLCRADSVVTSFLNRTVFSWVGISVPEGYVSLFWDSGSVIPAFRFNFITLVSSMVLISLDIVDFMIPAVFLFVYGALVKIFGTVFIGGQLFNGDVILALLTSGTLFSTLYVLQWYGTIPITNTGKICYGFIAGVVAYFVMGFGNSAVGYMFMILLMDIVSCMIHVYESKHTKKIIVGNLIPKLKARREIQ